MTRNDLRIVDSGFARYVERERRLLDDPAVAARRMAHLEKHGVRLVPLRRLAPAAPEPTPNRERLAPIARAIRHVQMWHTTNTSALK